MVASQSLELPMIRSPRPCFGSTYYALVGLHASHVIAGMVMLLTVAAFGLAGRVRPHHAERADVISIYWHFVDIVWIVIFTLVYLIP